MEEENMSLPQIEPRLIGRPTCSQVPVRIEKAMGIGKQIMLRAEHAAFVGEIKTHKEFNSRT
jgi:hypothetical protein